MPTNINRAMTFQSYMSQHMITINSVTLFLQVNKLTEIQWRNYFLSSPVWSPNQHFWTEGTNETFPITGGKAH
jgi:peptidoglycan/LPS O-acetylase OafA/YrhL